MSVRRVFGIVLACVAGLAAQACGGATDVPRVEDDRVLAERPLSCDVSATYTETLSITTFDTQGAFDIACGNPPDVLCSDFPNNDTQHAPNGTIDVPDDRTYDCKSLITPSGQRVESGVIESWEWVAETTERCAATTSALHFTAANLSMCYGSNGRRGWGGSYEIDFEVQRGTERAKAPIDASAWDGFSFWVRRGAGSQQGSIIVLAVDLFASGPAAAPGEVSCRATDPEIGPLAEEDFTKCDPFAAGITLTDEWTFVPVYFSEMRQKGFGMPAPLGLNTAELLRLQFLVSPGDWDLWIDDVSFFRAP